MMPRKAPIKKTEETPVEKPVSPKKVTPKKEVKSGIKKAAPKKEEPIEELPKKPATKKAPTKKEEPVKTEPVKKIPVADRVGPSKTKKLSDDKYVRIPDDSDIEKFKEMSQRIQNGSIQWAFYAIDGDKGYHYYLILKK